MEARSSHIHRYLLDLLINLKSRKKEKLVKVWCSWMILMTKEVEWCNQSSKWWVVVVKEGAKKRINRKNEKVKWTNNKLKLSLKCKMQAKHKPNIWCQLMEESKSKLTSKHSKSFNKCNKKEMSMKEINKKYMMRMMPLYLLKTKCSHNWINQTKLGQVLNSNQTNLIKENPKINLVNSNFNQT